MRSVNSTYRFYLILPNEGRTRVYPCNDQIKFCWRWNEDLCTWRYELDTTLLFNDHKGNPHKTFTALYDLEQQCGVCYEIPIEIEEWCNGQWQLHWLGYLPWRKGDWDLSKCTVSLKPRANDPFSCILRNWKKKYNLLDIEDKVEISTIKGVVECQEVVSTRLENVGSLPEAIDLFTVNPSPPSGAGWVLTSLEITVDNYFIDSVIKRTATFCRQCSTTQINTNWIAEAGQFYAPVNTSSPTTTYLPKTYFLRSEVIDLNIDNAVTLKDAIEHLLQDCDINICSDFFGINPIGDAPNNIAYDCAEKELQNIVLVVTKDVVRPVDTNAFKWNKCFGEIYSDFKKKFKLEMFFDENTNCVRIEHVSFNLSRKMLDMTKGRLLDCLKGRRKYKYDDQNFPNIIKFSDKLDEGTVDWIDSEIAFNPLCSDENNNTNERTIRLECMISEVSKIYNKVEEYIDNDDVLLSMTPIALDGNGEIIRGVGNISGKEVTNSPFAWSNVIKKYWLHDSPLKNGEINGEQQVFLSTLHQRKQERIEFKLKCEDWERFRPWDGVKTQFGWGRPDRSEVCRTVPGGKVEIEPTFQCD